MESAFILGVDGKLGSALWESISAMGVQLEGTTRRTGSVNKSIQYFDLDSDSSLTLAPSAGVAYLCAAVTRIAECEAEPVKTRKINVLRIVEVARQLRQSGRFIVFLSSSAVFDGAATFPDESTIPNPTSEYGRQKSEAESRLLELGGVAVVRLTKVIGANEARILAWRDRLMAGCVIDPYKDLFIAPISMKYVVQLLKRIGDIREAGVWHASGDKDVSYAEFALLLADSLGVDRELIEPIVSPRAATKLMYLPAHAALGMRETKTRIGLDPQPVQEVISQFHGLRMLDLMDSRKRLRDGIG